MQALTYANIDEWFGERLPTATEVLEALRLTGFDVKQVSLVDMTGITVTRYRVIIRGQADADPKVFMKDLLGSFCEQATVPILYTRHNDVILVLQLVA